MDTFTVSGPDISTAWIRACKALDQPPNRRGYHTVVRIADPIADDPRVRFELDRILESKNKQSVRTVANTIFPAALARAAKDHDALVARYKKLFPSLKRLHQGNRLGTYFDRLINYPGPGGSTDQIALIIGRLRQQLETRGPMTACYEANLVDPASDHDGEAFTVSAPVRVPGVDNNIMQFPCLSHCSFQLDREGRLHLTALYRSQYMIERAYGNYVGLGELLAYIAHNSRLQVGGLTVVAGYAQLDGGYITKVRPLLTEAEIPPAA
jgi:thymidylate synthase